MIHVDIAARQADARERGRHGLPLGPVAGFAPEAGAGLIRGETAAFEPDFSEEVHFIGFADDGVWTRRSVAEGVDADWA